MKTKKGMRLASALLAVLLAVCVLPASSLAVLPDYLEITKDFPSKPAAPFSSLGNGQVLVDRVAKSEGNSPVATIEISALGREFSVTEQVARKYNIMFVLDRSNSMKGDKDDNMATAANSAISTLRASNAGNKIGIVTFGSAAQLDRPLSTSAVTLTASGGPGINVEAHPGTLEQGATNIQAGLNEAYTELNKNLSDGAIPIIILLSDGAPTLYYTAIDEIPLSSGYKAQSDGSGTQTTLKKIAMTVVQAAYLKAMMPGLSIYTIAFDITTAEAKATLNPIGTHIDGVAGLGTELNNVKNTQDKNGNYTYITDDDIRGKLVYSYADGWYEADKSAESLKEALANIINKIKISGPIAESPKSPTNSDLAESSYVRITDSIGTGFSLASTATITLNNTDNYTFTRSGNTFSYSGADVRMKKIVLTYSDGNLVWKIPGSVLPCISADGNTKPAPIKLTYFIELSGNDLTEGLYKTSSNCEVWFTPAPDNPAYEAAIEYIPNYTAQNIPLVETTTTYYKAVYTLSGSTPTILGIGSGASENGPYTAIDVSSPSYNSSKLTVKYNGTNIEFATRRAYTVTGTFKTNTSTKAGVTTRTVSISSPILYDAARGVGYNDESTSNGTVTSFNDSGSNISSIATAYTVAGISCKHTFASSLGKNNNNTWSLPSSLSAYITTASMTQSRMLYSYNSSTKTLTLDVNGGIVLKAGTVGNVTTTFDTLNAANGTFVVTVHTNNGDGTYSEVVYEVANNKLSIKSITPTLSASLRKEQTIPMSSFGSMQLTSSDIIIDVTLTSSKGATIVATPVTVNDVRGYEATVTLAFYAKAQFSNLTFDLEAVNGSKVEGLSNYTVMSCSPGLTQNTDGTFSAAAKGPYSILLTIRNPFTSPLPTSFLVRFDRINYQTGAGTAKTLAHNDGYVNQQVKVFMNSPAKH